MMKLTHFTVFVETLNLHFNTVLPVAPRHRFVCNTIQRGDDTRVRASQRLGANSSTTLFAAFKINVAYQEFPRHGQQHF